MSSNSLKFTAGRWLFFFWFQKCHFFFFLFFLWIFKIWCQAGPGSKFSNLQQVGDFSIFGSFFWGVEGHKIWVLLGGFNCADWTVHLRDWATTMSLRGPATQHLHNESAKRASSMGWKCFILRRDSAKQNPNGVHFDSFHFIVSRYWTPSIYWR